MKHRAQSDVFPAFQDTTSSKVVNYLRENVTERETEDGTIYEYDEYKVPKDYWEIFLSQKQQQADIDFIAAMTEVEL